MALEEKVNQSLALDFPEESQENRHLVLSALLNNRDNARTIKQLAEETGVTVKSTRLSLQHMEKLTEAYPTIYGFKVKCVHLDMRTHAYILEDRKIRKIDRRRPLTIMPRGEQVIDITDQARSRISRLVDAPLLERPPRNAVSIVGNSGVIQTDSYERPYFFTLLGAAKRGRAVGVEHLKTRLDIPLNDERMKSNIATGTELRALELGFVITSVRTFYHAMFFLEPEDRSKALNQKYGEYSVYLDDVMDFNLYSALRMIDATDHRILDDQQKAITRKIARAQVLGDRCKTQDLVRKFGVTRGQIHHIKARSVRNRFELGFYIRTIGSRENSALECVLVDFSEFELAEQEAAK